MKIHVALSTNERYAIGATVAAAGVAAYAKTDTEIEFHLFTEQVSDKSFARFESTVKSLHPNCRAIRHECTEEILSGLPYWAGSRMAAVRCYYASLLPDVDWCLYLDCDVLYFASVEEHFSFCDDRFYACVVQEESVETRQCECRWIRENCDININDSEYFNSGVILFNFKQMRKDGIPNRLATFFSEHKQIPSPDQDALNAVLGGNVKMLPQKFNRIQVLLTDSKLDERPVIHYVSGNPWIKRYMEVASNRFFLWHQFADKFVWHKEGDSLKYCFKWHQLFIKKSLFFFMKMPLVNIVFCLALRVMGYRRAFAWRDAQVRFDCTKKMIHKILEVA